MTDFSIKAPYISKSRHGWQIDQGLRFLTCALQRVALFETMTTIAAGLCISEHAALADRASDTMQLQVPLAKDSCHSNGHTSSGLRTGGTAMAAEIADKRFVRSSETKEPPEMTHVPLCREDIGHMSAAEFRKHGYALVDQIANYYSSSESSKGGSTGSVESMPVLSQVKPGYLHEALPLKAPDAPDSWENIMNGTSV